MVTCGSDGVRPVCSEPRPSSAGSRAAARCQPFSRLLSPWCANYGLEASNTWRNNVRRNRTHFNYGRDNLELAPGSQLTTNTWDGENRLTQVALPTAITDIFTYNGDG